MIRVVIKQLVHVVAIISFSLSPIYVHAEGETPAPDAGSGDPSKTDYAGIGLDEVQKEVGMKKTILDTEAKNTAALKAPGYAAFKKEVENYLETSKSCVSKHDIAAKACLENLSPNIQDGVAALNTLASVLGMTGVQDNCSGFSNAMDVAKKAMTAYTGACGAAKGFCGSSCSSADKSLAAIKNAKSDCTPVDPINNPNACQTYNQTFEALKTESAKDANAGDQKSVEAKKKLCTQKYAQLLTSALAGIASMLNGMKQGDQCKKESEAETPKTDTAAVEKCKDPKNDADPECICLKNPLTAGCSNGLKSPTNAGELGTGQTDKTNVSSSSGGPSLPSDPGGIQQGTPGENSASSGLPGAPGGGGAGLGGSSGGGAGAPTGNGQDTVKKGLNANILSGAGGGGGGGWGAFGGGGGSDKYRQYLPGGAKDPNRNIAGQQSWKNEVTGQGGKSNWEKVKDRYRDNKNTLLSN